MNGVFAPPSHPQPNRPDPLDAASHVVLRAKEDRSLEFEARCHLSVTGESPEVTFSRICGVLNKGCAWSSPPSEHYSLIDCYSHGIRRVRTWKSKDDADAEMHPEQARVEKKEKKTFTDVVLAEAARRVGISGWESFPPGLKTRVAASSEVPCEIPNGEHRLVQRAKTTRSYVYRKTWRFDISLVYNSTEQQGGVEAEVELIDFEGTGGDPTTVALSCLAKIADIGIFCFMPV
tara:strand:- start:4867 stop:5565 length:699 start_codon:yes stop_codon:yes gene_type:complete